MTLAEIGCRGRQEAWKWLERAGVGGRAGRIPAFGDDPSSAWLVYSSGLRDRESFPDVPDPELLSRWLYGGAAEQKT